MLLASCGMSSATTEAANVSTPAATEASATASPTPAPTPSVDPARAAADRLIDAVRKANEPVDATDDPTPSDRPAPVGNPIPPEVILAGEKWFGGYGVNVCTDSSYEYCGDELHVGGVGYNWWQCVELAQRLYMQNGWYDGVFAVTDGTVSGAIDIYDRADELGMERRAYNDVYQIASGDMIVHNSAGPDSSDGGYGHVSIVDHVIGNTVHVVEQNVSGNGRATYFVVDHTLVRADLNTVAGVVSSPNNRANKPYSLTAVFDNEEFEEYLARYSDYDLAA